MYILNWDCGFSDNSLFSIVVPVCWYVFVYSLFINFMFVCSLFVSFDDDLYEWWWSILLYVVFIVFLVAEVNDECDETREVVVVSV